MSTSYALRTISNDHYEIVEKKPGKPLTIHSSYDTSWEAEDALDKLRENERDLHKKPSQAELIDWLSDTFQKIKYN